MLQSRKIIFIAAGMALCFFEARIVFAGNPDNVTMPSIAPQSEITGGLRAPAPQSAPSPDRTLELAPQPAASPGAPESNELPVDRAFKQSEERAALDRNFHPAPMDLPRRPPYLGLTVEYTDMCFRGFEEHGVEVISVAPGSPGARAGIRGRGASAPSSPDPTESMLEAIRRRIASTIRDGSHPPGSTGDMIVAVDDHRVRSRLEWEAAISRLKPGDTAYLTVIRPVPGRNHQTLKIAIKIDREANGVARSHGAPGELNYEAGLFSY
jgi:hypothetical protein